MSIATNLNIASARFSGIAISISMTIADKISTVIRISVNSSVSH